MLTPCMDACRVGGISTSNRWGQQVPIDDSLASLLAAGVQLINSKDLINTDRV